MIDFATLASSSQGCCYVLRSGNLAPLMIDCGIRWRDIQIAMNFKTSELAGVILSHSHGDHCKAVPDLIKAGINVYASKEAIAELGVQSHRLKPLYRPENERKCHIVEIGGWTIQGFEAQHDSPGTLGFLIGTPDGDRMLYLTDSAYSRFTFEGLTQIAIECNYSRDILRENAISGRINAHRGRRTIQNHMSLERLVDMLKANDLSKVEAIYLLHLSDSNSCEVTFKETIARATGIPVYICAKRSAQINK